MEACLGWYSENCQVGCLAHVFMLLMLKVTLSENENNYLIEVVDNFLHNTYTTYNISNLLPNLAIYK